MTEEKLKKWIRRKLDQGIEENRIRKSLENSGHDPSLVDEALEEDEESEEVTRDSEVEEVEEEFEQEEETDEKDEEEVWGERYRKKAEEKEEEHKTSNLISRKRVLIALAAIGLVGLGFGATKIQSSHIEQITDISVTPDYTGCRNQGVSIQSVSTSGGKTEATLKVFRNKSKVVLKIYQDGKLQGKAYSTFIGEKNVTVDATGNEAVLHPVDCKRYIIRRSY